MSGDVRADARSAVLASPRDKLEEHDAWSRLRIWAGDRQAVLVTYVASRLIVIFTTFVAGWHSSPGRSTSIWSPILERLGSWDAAHYRYIAAFGYSASTAVKEGTPDVQRLAFFPLWPLLERVADFLVPGIGLLGMSVLLVHVLTLAGVLRLRSLILRETGSTYIADRACIYLLIFPSAYILSMGYGDALFLLLSVLFFDLIRQNRWGWASLVGILGGLTRPQGVVLAMVALIEGLLYVRRSFDRGMHIRRRLSILSPPAVSVLAPLAGMGAYFLYVQLRFGDFLLVVTQQWQPQWKQAPSFFLWEAIRKVGEIFTIGIQPNVLLGGLVLLATILAIYSFRILPFSFAAYSLVTLGLSTSTRNFVVADRYVLMVFPLFWILALLGKRGWLDAGYRAVSPVLMGSLAILAWLGSWVP